MYSTLPTISTTAQARLLQLRIITAGLAGGALMVLGFLETVLAPEAEASVPILRFVLPAVALSAVIIGGWIVPNLIATPQEAPSERRNVPDHIDASNPYAADSAADSAADRPAGSDTERPITAAHLQRYSTKHLLRCASLEGAAMLMAIGGSLDSSPIFPMLAVAGIIGILSQWPTENRLRRA